MLSILIGSSHFSPSFFPCLSEILSICAKLITKGILGDKGDSQEGDRQLALLERHPSYEALPLPVWGAGYCPHHHSQQDRHFLTIQGRIQPSSVRPFSS